MHEDYEKKITAQRFLIDTQRAVITKHEQRIADLEAENVNLKSLLEQLIFIAERSPTDDSEDTTIELAAQALKGK